MKPITQSLTSIERKELINLVIPRKVFDKIMYICNEIYNEEWSGVLFYIIKGSIRKPKTLTLTAIDFLPMDKGTKVHTGYDFDEDVVTYMMDKQFFGDGKALGMIHSHNTMNVFFSGEDNSELEDNTPNHKLYLSLIVNNRMDMCAKVAYRAKTNQVIKYTALDENGDEYEIVGEAIEKEVMYWHKVNIQTPAIKVQVEKEFMDRVAFIIDKAQKKADTKAVVKVNSNGSQGEFGYQWDNQPKTTDFEDLAIYILNGGKSKGYQTMYNCMGAIIREGTEVNKLARNVVENYLKSYMKYYQVLRESDINSTTYMHRLDGVINTLKSYTNHFPVLTNIILQLESYKSKLYVTN